MPEDTEIAIYEDGVPVWRSLRDWKPSVDDQFEIIGETDSNGNPITDENAEQIQPDFFYDSPFAGKRFKHKLIEVPNIGNYKIRGSKKIAAMVYGYEQYGSFGFHENLIKVP